MRKGMLKRLLAGFMVFTLTCMSVDAGCITVMAADLQIPEQELQFNTGLMPLELIPVKGEMDESKVYEYHNYVEKNYGSAYYNNEWEKYSSYYIYNQLSDEYKAVWDAFNELCLTYLTSYKDYVKEYIELPDNTSIDDGATFVRLFLASNPQYYFLTNGISYYSDSNNNMVSFAVLPYEAFVDGTARSEATADFKAELDAAISYISAGETESIHGCWHMDTRWRSRMNY